MRNPVFVVLVLVGALVVPAAAGAGPRPAAEAFVVDDAGDHEIDTPTGCRATDSPDSTCTLREAIREANDNGNAPAVDQITFDLPTGTVISLDRSFNIAGPSEPNLDGGDLDITGSVVIDGPGITVDASGINTISTFASAYGNQDRVFDIHNGAGDELDVTLRGLTITGGFTQPGEHGGGVRATNCGAGVRVLLDDVRVSGNMADPPSYPSWLSRGGGVYGQMAQLEIQDSTISGNLAQQGGGVALARYGSGQSYACSTSTPVYADEGSTNRADLQASAPGLMLTDSTVSGNAMARNIHGSMSNGSGYAQHPPDDGSGSQGAGIWSDMDTTLTGVVVSGNGAELTTPITGPDGTTTFAGAAPWQGGGVHVGPEDFGPRGRNGSPSLLAVSRTWIDGNSALYAGGGVHAVGTYLDLFDSSVTNNAAGPAGLAGVPVGGGGLALVNVDGLTRNTTVAVNTADDGSAILNVYDGRSVFGRSHLDASFLTVAANVPATSTDYAQAPAGGSIQVTTDGSESPDSAAITVFNSILQSSTSGAPTCVVASDFATIASVGGNSDDDGSCGLTGTGDGTPVTQSLGGLAANGTTNEAGDPPQVPIPTMALLTGAEAIDAAIDEPDATGTVDFAGVTITLVCGGTTTDQRGVLRPQDGDNDGTAVCDRGAYEFVYQPPPTSTPTVDVGVSKTGPAEVAVGDAVQYTIVVTNVRNRADNVVVSDTVPSGLSLVGASAPCTTSGASISCDLGSILSTETATITVDATAVSEGTFTNTACASTSDRDSNSANNCDSHTVTVTGEDTTERVEGPERVTTAVAGSQVIFDDGMADAVVLTRADDFPDAQAGTPLAIARDAAMLLSQSDVLSSATEEEIQRVLLPGRIVYLLGGTAALSQAVEDRVVELGYTAVRLAGLNRFGTAVAIAQELGDPGTMLLANGFDFPAAVVAGAAAVVAGDSDFAASYDQTGDVGAAVLLTAGENIPPETQTYLDGLADAELIPVGAGATAAFPGEEDAITGGDRYELSVNVAEAFFTGPSAIGVATGADFADALIGGSLVGRPSVGPGPMLLSAPDALPDSVGDYVGANVDTISRLFIFGGPAAITPPVEDELNTILGIEPTE